MAEAARWLTVLEEARGLLRLADAVAPHVARRPSAVVGLDEVLGGGVPVGRVVEVWGALGSGGTALVLALAAGVTARGGTVAWVDAFDALDPASMAASGCDLARVLWIRATPTPHPIRGEGAWSHTAPEEHGPSRNDGRTTAAHRRQLLRALDLVLSTDGLALVVLDVLAGPGRKRLFVPDTTWLRVARTCETHRTTLVVLGERPAAGAQSTLSLSMGLRSEGSLRVKVSRSRGPLVRGEGELRVVASPTDPWVLRHARGRAPGARASKPRPRSRHG